MNSAERNFTINVFAWIGLGVLLVSCSTTEDSQYTKLWDSDFSSCGNVSCHNSSADDGTERGPDLSSKDKFYANLVDKSVAVDYPAWASVKTGDCNQQKFIEPGDANRSTLAASLIQSVSDTLKANDGCDSSYNVHVANSVSISDTTALIDWINSGAKK